MKEERGRLSTGGTGGGGRGDERKRAIDQAFHSGNDKETIARAAEELPY